MEHYTEKEAEVDEAAENENETARSKRRHGNDLINDRQTSPSSHKTDQN